ncbi:hypothetical protein [Methylobacterium sp. Leaf108]|uniref:RusA family crossover junction endodeoxyribonuclease n=1 Tax=Methylobacterium sp. Leaf108 TaxID=1736256 RepID=UPI000700C0DD|nr:hypothetical protein [Methylobacterium sp. Leaf108]KQP61080.1 hypothetical protein ASF39_15525 [Methylobacterium sp. Leaf108]
MEAISASALRRNTCRLKPDERPCYTQRPIVGSVTIEIPMPPSANKLFANGAKGGRVKTAAYRSWRNHAALVGSFKRPGRISGPADVTIHLPPFKGDTDNRIKPLLDVAKQIGVIADDGEHWIRHVTAIRETTGTLVRMIFTMMPIDPLDVADAQTRARENQQPKYIAVALGLTIGQVHAILAGATA